MYEDLLIDFETLGVGRETLYFLVTDVALLPFDINVENTFEQLTERVSHYKFKLSEQKAIDWKAETETMAWWKTQSKELQRKLLPSDDDVNLRTFIENFVTLTTNNSTKRVWCRGMNFDIPILQRILHARKYNLDDYIHYSNYNDVRTYIRAYLGLKERDDFIPETAKDASFIKHNAIHDVSMDVMRLQYINSLVS